MNEGAAEHSSFILLPSSFLPNTPLTLRLATVFYLTHIALQGWVASSESFAWFFMLWLGWAAAHRQIRITFHILYFPLALYALVSTISAIAAPREIHGAWELMTWFKILLFPAALSLFRAVPQTRVLALRAHIAFAVYVAAYGLFQYFVLHQRDLEHRITGTASHVMTFSGLLLPLSLMLVVMSAHEKKPWLIAAAGLVTLALLLTFTRSVWLGWIVAIFVLLTVTRARWLVFAAPAFVVFITFMPLSIFSRFVSTFDTKQSSNLDRIRMFEAGVEIIRDAPLLGVGPANVKEIYPLYRKHDAPRFRIPHLHNNVVQIWAERGILGLAAYVLLLSLFLRQCARAWRGPGRMWAEVGVAVTVGLTVAGLFEFNFGDTEVFYLMLDLFALVIASTEAAGMTDAPTLVP